MLYNYAVEIENWLKSIEDDNEQTFPLAMPWPPGLLSLLSLLQVGFANRKHLLPDYIRDNTGLVLNVAQNYGIFPDRKWALEVSGIAPDSDLIESLRPAIRDSSPLMNRVAYEQVNRLENIPEDISGWIRGSLIQRGMELQLYKQLFTTQAFVSRLKNRKEYLDLLRMMLVIPILDISLLFFLALIILIRALSEISIALPIYLLVIVLSYLSYFFSYAFLSDLSILRSSVHDKLTSSVPYGYSYLIRPFIVLFAFVSVNNEIQVNWIIAFGIIVTSYLILLPVSILFLLQGGFFWKHNIEVLAAPVIVWIHGIRQWNDKFASTKMVKSALVFLAFYILLVPISLLIINFGATLVMLVLTGLSVIPVILVLPKLVHRINNEVKERKKQKAKLEQDSTKLQLWTKETNEKRSGPEFLTLFRSLGTLEYQAKLVEYVSKNNSLKTGDESVQAIKGAIQYIETNTNDTSLIDNLFILLERIQSQKEK